MPRPCSRIVATRYSPIGLIEPKPGLARSGRRVFSHSDTHLSRPYRFEHQYLRTHKCGGVFFGELTLWMDLHVCEEDKTWHISDTPYNIASVLSRCFMSTRTLRGRLLISGNVFCRFREASTKGLHPRASCREMPGNTGAQ